MLQNLPFEYVLSYLNMYGMQDASQLWNQKLLLVYMSTAQCCTMIPIPVRNYIYSLSRNGLWYQQSNSIIVACITILCYISCFLTHSLGLLLKTKPIYFLIANSTMKRRNNQNARACKQRVLKYCTGLNLRTWNINHCVWWINSLSAENRKGPKRFQVLSFFLVIFCMITRFI